MTLHSKVCAVVLASLAGAPLLAGNYYSAVRAGERLPSEFGYLRAIAGEDHRKIVILLTDSEGSAPCQLLERQVLRTWEWSTFAHHEIVFEILDVSSGNAGNRNPQSKTAGARHLRDKFGTDGLPCFIVAEADGTIISHMDGYSVSGPIHYMDWIRSFQPAPPRSFGTRYSGSLTAVLAPING